MEESKAGGTSRCDSSAFQRSAQNMLLGKRTNVILVKDDVGRAKPATRNLPNSDFAFGKASKFDESAADGKWQNFYS